MAEYEFIREIFNNCSGNQMRDVFVEDIEIDDIDAFMEQYTVGRTVEGGKETNRDGSISYDLTIDGLRQRFTFS